MKRKIQYISFFGILFFGLLVLMQHSSSQCISGSCFRNDSSQPGGDAYLKNEEFHRSSQEPENEKKNSIFFSKRAHVSLSTI